MASLTNAQYSQVVLELNRMAERRNWCYRLSGGLDSRDIDILVVHAEEIADRLFSGGPYSVGKTRLRHFLIQANWSEFRGTDYSGGGTEMRYRPPGCR